MRDLKQLSHVWNYAKWHAISQDPNVAVNSGAGVVGLYWVGAAIDARNQGIGAARDRAGECKIVELVDGEVYAYQSAFNGLFITSRHALTRLANGGTRITQHAEIAGPRAETVGPQIGLRITEDYPEAMEDLIAAARAGGPEK